MSFRDTFWRILGPFVTDTKRPTPTRKPARPGSADRPAVSASTPQRAWTPEPVPPSPAEWPQGSAGTTPPPAEDPWQGATAPPSTSSSADTSAGPDPLDLTEVYRSAGVPEAPFTAERALSTLATLPPDWPLARQGQALQGLLQPLGRATVEAVARDAEHKINALAAWTDEISKKAADLAVATAAVISDLERQITIQRQAIEAAQARAREISGQCQAEAARLAVVSRVLGRSAH
jgi:hypothetical protein